MAAASWWGRPNMPWPRPPQVKSSPPEAWPRVSRPATSSTEVSSASAEAPSRTMNWNVEPFRKPPSATAIAWRLGSRPMMFRTSRSPGRKVERDGSTARPMKAPAWNSSRSRSSRDSSTSKSTFAAGWPFSSKIALPLTRVATRGGPMGRHP